MLLSLCGFVVGSVIFIGGFAIKKFSMNRVDDLFKMMHLRSCALSEVGSLGIPPADEFVAVFDRAFFP